MLARIAPTVRNVPRLTALAPGRFTSSRSEGSVAQSKGFSKKEKAHEDQYINEHERALLQKLKAQVEAKEKELADLQNQHEKLKKSAREDEHQ